MKSNGDYTAAAVFLSNLPIKWDGNGKDKLSFSTQGYKHMSHAMIEEALFKFGFYYDFEGKTQEFDEMCGRTTTDLKIKRAA